VAERLATLDCDPIEGMVRLAMDESQDPTLRGRMYAELACYEHPKRKAVEHSGQVDGAPRVHVCIEESEGIGERLMQAMRKRANDTDALCSRAQDS
jgi:hypothetical protein